MQPKTEVKFDQETFERMKRTIRNMAVSKRKIKADPAFATPLPDEVGVQLTNRCNLRCKHCFQWNDDGFYHHYDQEAQKQEIDYDVIERILDETFEVKSNLYLWGGEPLCYSEWERLSIALEKDPRWTVFCTNGVDIDKKLESLLRFSQSLAMLISLEGFQSENDQMRGEGTYAKVIKNIEQLIELKQRKIFKGEISVNCVINEAMIGKLFDFAEMLEAKAINSLYFCFPWYITDQTAQKMDLYFKEHFDWLRTLQDGRNASWYGYQYRLNPDQVEALLADLARISQKRWRIRLRYQPALENDEITGFILGREQTGQKRSRCLGIANRMNVLANGKVTVCKLFPEFEIGNLNKNSVDEVWNHERFQRAREIISRGLMPVCSKCVLLYLHGA